VKLGAIREGLPGYLAMAVTDAKKPGDVENNGDDATGELVDFEMINAAEFASALVVDESAFDIVG
jgi:hypothetical protein